MRHRESERLGGPEIDHELELARLLDGEVRWAGALQHAIDKVGQPSEHPGEVRAVRHQAALGDVTTHLAGRRQMVRAEELQQDAPVVRDDRRRQLHQTLGAPRLRRSDRRREVVRALYFEGQRLESQGLGRRFHGIHGTDATAHLVPDHRDPGEARDGEPQEVEPLRAQLGVLEGDPGDVPPGVSEALHETQGDGVVEARDDRGRRRGALDRGDRGWGRRDDDIQLEIDQFLGQTGKPVEMPFGPPILDHDALALDVAEGPQPVAERGQPLGLHPRIHSEKTHPRSGSGALCLGRRRHGEQGADDQRSDDQPGRGAGAPRT